MFTLKKAARDRRPEIQDRRSVALGRVRHSRDHVLAEKLQERKMAAISL
jgi:hypothetical protein